VSVYECVISERASNLKSGDFYCVYCLRTLAYAFSLLKTSYERLINAWQSISLNTAIKVRINGAIFCATCLATALQHKLHAWNISPSSLPCNPIFFARHVAEIFADNIIRF
jgi:hypothetical protein